MSEAAFRSSDPRAVCRGQPADLRRVLAAVPPLSGMLSFGNSLAAAPDGGIVVSDAGGQRIRLISRSSVGLSSSAASTMIRADASSVWGR